MVMNPMGFKIESVTKNTNKQTKKHQQIILSSTQIFPINILSQNFQPKNPRLKNPSRIRFGSVSFFGASKGAANKQKAIHAKTKPKNLRKMPDPPVDPGVEGGMSFGWGLKR